MRDDVVASTCLVVVEGGEVWEDSGGNEFELFWKWEMWKKQ